MRRAVLLVLAAATLAAAAPAFGADSLCTNSGYGSRPPRALSALRFGIDPELAGTVGTGQQSSAPEDPRKQLAALKRLRPPHRAFVLRVNRMFWSDSEAGLRRFKRTVHRYAAAGFDVELQVRYHPPAGHDGDLRGWTAYVRRAVDVFGPERHVVALTITNEINLAISPNTSDGAYQRARDALIQGIVAARREADRHGWKRLKLGFTYAYRWNPQSDAALFDYLGAHGGPAFRHAVGFVGLDLYPGSFYPPAVLSYRTATATALGTMRDCFLAKAKLGRTPIWITENGYPSFPAPHTEAGQVSALRDTVTAIHDWSRTYNVTDYRYFNLRDNDSSSPALFATDGLLRDDYATKPAFGAFRSLVVKWGRRTR